jgi:hypothetical protein
MYATVRRYECIDKARSEEVTRKVGESLLPSLAKLPGFSVGLFENFEGAEGHRWAGDRARGVWRGRHERRPGSCLGLSAQRERTNQRSITKNC